VTFKPLPLVYVAGPYSSDPVHNTRRAILVGEELEQAGCAVLIPHLSLLWDLVSPAGVERWYERDLHLLARCDALVRLNGRSVGVQAEVVVAREREIPVFEHPTARTDFGDWVARWKEKR
jgi:hypothetical protein